MLFSAIVGAASSAADAQRGGLTFRVKIQPFDVGGRTVAVIGFGEAGMRARHNRSPPQVFISIDHDGSDRRPPSHRNPALEIENGASEDTF